MPRAAGSDCQKRNSSARRGIISVYSCGGRGHDKPDAVDENRVAKIESDYGPGGLTQVQFEADGEDDGCEKPSGAEGPAEEE